MNIRHRSSSRSAAARSRVSSSRSGVAPSRVLWVLVLALAAFVAAIFFFDRGAAEKVAADPRPPTRAVEKKGVDESPPASTESTRSAATSTSSGEKPQGLAQPTHSSRASGVIRGELSAVPGIDLPKVWTLTIEPHPFLKGRENAVTRRLEFANGEKQFKVEGLPLAGYSVRVQAAGLNDVPCNALLVEGSDNVFVNPQFRPAGFIDGNVLDDAGSPVEDMTVTITSEPAHVRTSVRTDARGNYMIPNVTDGDYLLSIGPPDAPLMKPDRLSFKSPSLRFPTRQLPETGLIRLKTIDESGRALADTEVSGFSTTGAALRVKTDGRGLGVIKHLTPGKYRLEAKIEDGRKAAQWVDVMASKESVVEMKLKP